MGAVRPMETVTQWSGAVQKHFRLSCSDSEESDDDVLSVGAVWPLTTAAPLGGAGLMVDCQLHVDSEDDDLSVGAWAPTNGPERCLDDFDWVVPHYEQNMLWSGWDMEVGTTDIGRDIRVLPDVFPVLFEETAAVPMSLPVVVETGRQFDCDTDILLSGRDVEVEIMDIGRHIRVLPDVFPVMFDEKNGYCAVVLACGR